MLLLICLTLKGAVRIAPTPPIPITATGGGGASVSIGLVDQNNVNKRLEQQIIIEDEEIMVIIKAFLRCQN